MDSEYIPLEYSTQSNLPSPHRGLVSYNAGVTAAAPAQMNLTALAQHSKQENQRFYDGQPYDPSFAYELFRRAVVERDQLAWQHIYAQYFTLVERWVQRSGAFAQSGESSDFFVQAAFIRFWQAVTAERFASFATLSGLLNYLQQCAKCVVIDNARKEQSVHGFTETAIPAHLLPQGVSEEEVLDRIDRISFWDCVNGLLHSEAERVVIFLAYVRNLKPRVIYAQRPDLFTDVSDVYITKRNILERLQRNKEVRYMRGS